MLVSLQKIYLKSVSVRQGVVWQECSAICGERAESGNGAKQKKSTQKVNNNR